MGSVGLAELGEWGEYYAKPTRPLSQLSHPPGNPNQHQERGRMKSSEAPKGEENKGGVAPRAHKVNVYIIIVQPMYVRGELTSYACRFRAHRLHPQIRVICGT